MFFTAGQLTPEFVECWQAAGGDDRRMLLRTATRPSIELPASVNWLEAIGPFDAAAERALFERHAFDALVSKNSGGDATSAKLAVARELGVPVFMLRRPTLAQADAEFDAVDACVEFITARHGEVA